MPRAPRPRPQLPLFQAHEQPRSRYRVQGLPQISAPALLDWKTRVAQFQQTVRNAPIPEQLGLFDQEETSPVFADVGNPDRVAPFGLRFYGFEFWRSQQGPAQPTIYFVLDDTAKIVLYVGEAVNAQQRWAGEHDCKRYVRNYRALHFDLGLDCAIATVFWLDVFPDARRRQQQEQHLIQRWRSPFNKENWITWATPFVDGRIGGDS